MIARLRQFGQRIHESLWFMPGLLVLGAFGLAYGLVSFDGRTDWQGEKQFPLLFGLGAEGSRGMLTAIAGSMLTVAALAFSSTLTAITQVSSQYSPRVLRTFLRDRINQFVMGYFVATFAYCLVVLGTIRGANENKFVPATAVLVGLFLALGGVVALIVFIHHMAASLQTGTIVRNIYEDTRKAIDRALPDLTPNPVDEPTNPDPLPDANWQRVTANETGYVETINTDQLFRWACRHQTLIRVEREVGAFVDDQTSVLSVQDSPKLGGGDWPDTLHGYVSIGPHRNIEQDIAFGIQQLVDIALKALSPGVNDTTTAIMAVDYLGAVVGQLAGRSFPTRFHADGTYLRLVVQAADFDAYLRLAFDLPRLNAKGNHAVLRRLLRALANVAAATQSAGRRASVRRQVDLLVAYAEQTATTDYEKGQVRQLAHDLLPL